MAVVDVRTIATELTNPNYAVQFVGEKGYGKTTHLLKLRDLFPSAGYVHIPEGETRPVPEGVPIMIDEAQRLTWWQRKRLFPRKVALVMGTHTDYESALKRSGREVRTVHVGQFSSTERIEQLLNTRIEYVRRSHGPVPIVTARTVRQLQEKHGCNIRSMLYDLYKELQNLNEICRI